MTALLAMYEFLKAHRTFVNAGIVMAPIAVTLALEVFEPHYMARLIVAGIYGVFCAYAGKKYL